MKKRFLRAVAGVMTLLLLTTGLSGATAVYAGEDTAAATKQEKVLTVTQDMVGKNGILTITGEWDRIVIPKEIDASRIKFKKVKTGSVEIESGNKSKIEVDSGEYGEIAVVPAKVEEMSVEELLELMRLTGDPHIAIEQYQKQREQNDAYLDARPTVVTGKDAEVGTVTLSGNVKLDCKNGTVANLKVEADGSQKELNVNVSNYEGNVSVKQTEREDGDWMIARVKMNNSKVENLDMEGAGRGNIVLSGQNTEVKDVNVASAPTVSLNLPSQNVNVKETAKSAVLNILAKIESILIHANDVKMDVGSCGSIADAKIEGDNIFVTGNGTLLKVDITGDGAYVSTVGTDVTGKNNYVPPAPVGGIRDLGGLHVVVGDWFSYNTSVPTTEEEIARAKYLEEMMEKYNFTIEQKAITDWDSMQDVFRTSVELGTPAAQVFIMDPRFIEDYRDYFYDLSKLYELDFDEDKWDDEVKAVMTYKDGIYGMSAQQKEARGGVIINKELLEEAGYDPEYIFDLQATGEWTWSKLEEMCEKINAKLNTEEKVAERGYKIYPLTSNEEMLLKQLINSTGTEVIGYENGEYVNNLEDENVQKAWAFAKKLFEEGYERPDTPENAVWTWVFDSFREGKAVMQFGESYYLNVGDEQEGASYYKNMEEELGFVCCPKPDEGDGSEAYYTYFSDNIAVIPACYDAKTASDIAFAYNIFTNPAPGYENDPDAWKVQYSGANMDERTIEETLSMYYSGDMKTVKAYINFMQELEEYAEEDPEFDFDGSFFWGYRRESFQEIVDEIGEKWDKTVEAANQRKQLYVPAVRPGSADFDYNASEYIIEVRPDGTLRLKKHKNPDSQGTDVVIPSELFGRQVTEIGPNAFRGRNITSVVIPEGVTTISPFAFGYCTELTSVTTPNSLTTIANNAFYGCTGLCTMNLSSRVTSIGDLAFAECWTENKSNLLITTTKGSYADTFAQAHNIPVQYEGQISELIYEVLQGDDGPEIWITGYKTVAENLHITERIDGKIVAVVSGGAFKNCTDITSVEIDFVYSIGDEAFAGCTGLTEVNLPNTMWGIGVRAFAGCTGLKEFSVPEGVTTIGNYAFADCTGLKELYIPESVTTIGVNTFDGCSEDIVVKAMSDAVIEVAKAAGIKNIVDLREQQ